MKPQNFLKNYLAISKKYPNIKILTVIKYFSPEESNIILNQAKSINIKDFSLAENRIQSAINKTWILKNSKSYFIGPLQTNKVKKTIEIFDVIESVDRLKLAIDIDKKSYDFWKKQEIYLQINISWEEQKSWFTPNNFQENYDNIIKLKNLNITWLMAMASKWSEAEIRNQFKKMKKIFDKIRIKNPNIKHLSMWMSWDYKMAIEQWANEVRLGSILFN